MLSHYDTDDAIIIRDLVDSDTISEMRQAVIERARKTTPGAKSGDAFWEYFHGNNTTRFTSLGQLTPAFFQILENRIFNKLCDELLKPVCTDYWLNTAQAMLIGPGEPAQVLHRDSGNWPFAIKPQWPDAPEITVSMMLALDDVSEVLGATRVIRGSHRRKDHNREGSPDETIAAELPSGSAMIYSGHVMHGGGTNQTEDKWRLAKHLSMVVGWLTPEEA